MSEVMETCSLCRTELIESDLESIGEGKENILSKLIKTLCEAANINCKFNCNRFQSCSSCNTILSEISIHNIEIHRQLLKLKSRILLRNNQTNGESCCKEIDNQKLYKILVQDFNPSLVLDKISHKSTRNKLPPRVKTETCVEIKQEIEHDDDLNNGEIIPDFYVDVSMEEEEDNSDDSRSMRSSSIQPEIKRRKRNRKRKIKKVISTQDEEQLEQKLLKQMDGSYIFMGITLTPVKSEQGKHYENKSQQNKYWKFKCGHCGQIVRGLYNLKCHIKETHFGILRYGNQKCITFRGEKIKLDSIRNADGNLILHGVQIVITSDEKKYKCGSCSVSYKTRCALLSHIRHLHAKIPRPPPKKAYGPQTEGTSHRSKSQITEDGRQLFCGVEIRSCGNEQENRFQCGRCSRTWKTKGNVMAHIKMHHPDTTPYKCPVANCEASFAYKHILEKHQVKHENGEAEFICDRCGKSCKRKGSLREHIRRVHLNVINFNCPHCHKGFFGKKDYRLHLKTHENLHMP